MIRNWSLVLALSLIPAITPSSAIAHAFNRRANPSAGSTLPASPPVLTLWFTEAVEPRFCTVEVRNEHGDTVSIGPLQVSGEGQVLTAALPKLPPGDYTVIWHVTSVDTHRTEGSYHFTIAP